MAIIPFNRVSHSGREESYVREVLKSGRVGGGGEFTKRCEVLLQKFLGGATVLLTNSCTSALEMSALLLDLKEGDEVIMPSFTFVSTANAVRLRGAMPRFVDIEPNTMNLDANLIEAAITKRTRAIMPVHYAGQLCDMRTITALGRKHGLAIVEDAAQALGSIRDGRAGGTWGSLAALSFHETKNISCGEGGALIVNDPTFVARARIIRDKGTNRDEFLKGFADKYSWVDLGSSYAISDILAAFLLGQLEGLDAITQRRQDLFNLYAELLRPLADRGLVRLPGIAPESIPNGHIFYLILDSEASRNAFIDHMRDAGIQTIFHYIPLHTAKFGQSLGYKLGDLPVTEDLAGRLVRLPVYTSLGNDELHDIVTAAFGAFRVKQTA